MRTEAGRKQASPEWREAYIAAWRSELLRLSHAEREIALRHPRGAIAAKLAALAFEKADEVLGL